jgi:hypothetical protein
MKRSLWQWGVVAVLVSLVLSTVLVVLSPDRMIDASIDGDYFVDETSDVLALETKLYVLQPTVLLRNALDALDWIDSYTIDRNVPNQIMIGYKTKLPIACSPSSIYFSTSVFAREERNETLCASAIQLNGLIGESVQGALSQLPLETRNLIQRIEFQTNEALVTLKTGQQAIVYPNDFRVLQSIARLAPTGTVLDLRRNYA